MKIYQYITIALVAIISMLPTQISNGCGYYEMDYYVYTFIEPNLMDEPYRPFFFTFQTYFTDWEGEKFAKEENLKEWSGYFKNQGNSSDFEHLIYKTSTKEVEAIRDKNKTALSEKSQANTVIQRLLSQPDEEFINYLIYAKSCEPLATKRDYVWDGKIDDETKQQHDNLIEEGLTAFHSCSSDFLKMRYAFQIVRLARYAMDWDETISWYNQLMPELGNVKSIIRYWTMEHFAGALYNKGDFAQSAYYFSRVFDKAPSRRFSAHRSFTIKTDEQWSKALEYCKNNEEQATLYAIRAIDPFSNAVEEMENIYTLSPKNQNLELLLIREIQKLEYEQLGSKYHENQKSNVVSRYDYENDKTHEMFPRKGSNQYLNALLTFVKKTVAENTVERPHVWRLAEGYLNFINGEVENAVAIYEELDNKNVGSKNFKHQVKIFKIAAVVENLKKVDSETEALAMEYLPILKSVRPDFVYTGSVAEQANFILDKLAYLYQQQGEMGKAFLCHKHDFYNLLYHPDLSVVNDLIKMYDRKDELSNFEKMLVKPVFFKESYDKDYNIVYKDENPDIRNQLLDIKGTILLANNQLDEAISVFNQLPDSYKNRTTPIPTGWEFPVENSDRFMLNRYDPFHLYLNNKTTHKPNASFDKLALAQRLDELERLSKTDSDNAAEHLFKLGNAHFEMSYHGRSWRALDYYWSEGGYKEKSRNVYSGFFDGFNARGNQSFRYNDNALEYLEKVMELENGSNREWVAKACFVAASCKSREEKNLREKYFNKLKEDYADTEFYQQAIKECGYFYSYVNK